MHWLTFGSRFSHHCQTDWSFRGLEAIADANKAQPHCDDFDSALLGTIYQLARSSVEQLLQFER
jgi:hypothetical protein